MHARDGARFILLSAATVVLIAGIRFASTFMTTLLLAAGLAIATNALVDVLTARRVPRSLALLAGLLADLAALALLVGVLGIALRRLSLQLPFYEVRITEAIADVALWLEGLGVDVSMNDVRGLVDPSAALRIGTSLVQGTASLISRLFVVLVLVAFMLAEAPRMRTKLGQNDMSETAERVRRYLLVKTGTSLLTGVLAFVLCISVGVDLPLLWGVLAYLLNYIPTIGSVIAALPAVAITVLELGFWPAMLVAAGFALINTLVGIILEPRWMGQALGLSPLVVLLSLLFWGFLLGPLGALLSAPLTMIVRDWLQETEDLRGLGTFLSD